MGSAGGAAAEVGRGGAVTERQARLLGPPYLQVSFVRPRIQQYQRHGKRCIVLLCDSAEHWSVQAWIFAPDRPYSMPHELKWAIWYQRIELTQLEAAMVYVKLQQWLRQRNLGMPVS